MARSLFASGLALALTAMMLARSSAQQAGCTPAIVSLTPCLGFITGNATAPTPSSPCCTQLASVVQTQARCLCAVLNGGAAQLGIIVNQTQALTLPGACKIQAPPLSQCNAATGAGSLAPAPAPASPATEVPSPAASPSAPATPSDISPTTSTPSTPSVPSDATPATPSVPSDATPATPATPSAPTVPSTSGSGSKTVPTAGQSSSARSSTDFTTSHFLAILLVASALASF